MAPPTKSESSIKKRRVIYMTDEEWDKLSERAAQVGKSKSATLVSWVWTYADAKEHPTTTTYVRPFTPVPKPGKKR